MRSMAARVCARGMVLPVDISGHNARSRSAVFRECGTDVCAPEWSIAVRGDQGTTIP
jgi:hypothetical protein